MGTGNAQKDKGESNRGDIHRGGKEGDQQLLSLESIAGDSQSSAYPQYDINASSDDRYFYTVGKSIYKIS
jgi:hypothetical protein